MRTSKHSLPLQGTWKPYGLRQEQALRDGLRRRGLKVSHSAELDRVHAVDCVVSDRRFPLLPAVGIQFTTRRDDQEKKARTKALFRRHSALPRLLYLQSEYALSGGAFPKISELIYATAQSRGKVVSAVLGYRGRGQYYFREVAGLPGDVVTQLTGKEERR